MPLTRRAPAGIVALAAALAAGTAAAQGPFGITTPETAAGPTGGLFGPLFAQIGAWQTEFYGALTDSLAELHDRGAAFWVLAGVSFLYGIFHAAGPGHGKAVIGAYLLASGETLRRGIVIAFAAALVQALVAIALVSIAAGILSVTAVTMNEATRVLEIGSYALIVVVGLWLLWTRLRGGHRHVNDPVPAVANVSVLPTGSPIPRAGAATHARVAHSHADDHDDGGHHHSHEHHHHDHPHGTESHAGHLHAPDPATLQRPLSLAGAWTAVLAVGIRPCSGALIILVFALAQGLYAAGIASTLVMALGTAITVSALAGLAVVARDLAVRWSRAGSRRVAIALKAIEIAAAAAVLLFGVLLLGGALSA